MATIESCRNCGREIGRLETPYVLHDYVVCSICHKKLKPTRNGRRALSITALGVIVGLLGVSFTHFNKWRYPENQPGGKSLPQVDRRQSVVAEAPAQDTASPVDRLTVEELKAFASRLAPLIQSDMHDHSQQLDDLIPSLHSQSKDVCGIGSVDLVRSNSVISPVVGEVVVNTLHVSASSDNSFAEVLAERYTLDFRYDNRHFELEGGHAECLEDSSTSPSHVSEKGLVKSVDTNQFSDEVASAQATLP